MQNLQISVTLSNNESINVTRVNDDMYGNPRYVIHFLDIASTYSEALRISRNIGGKMYTAKWYGGGIVFQSYALKDDLEYLMECAGKL